MEKVEPSDTELEFIAGESERRGAVSVGGVLRKAREDMHTDLHVRRRLYGNNPCCLRWRRGFL